MGSGKSTAVLKLFKFFQDKGKEVSVVSEELLLGGLNKNIIFSDSKHEKEVRGRLKSEVVRLLSKENVVICDGLNYIKGFRYELYCASKSVKSTREDTEKYNDNIIKELIQRYECPISSNRWD